MADSLFVYLFLTLAIVRTLVRLKEAYFSMVLCHLYQPHSRLHRGITSMDKYHHLKPTEMQQNDKDVTKKKHTNINVDNTKE